MKPRITVITLGVDDLDRSLKFYRDGLGLPTEGIVGQKFEHRPGAQPGEPDGIHAGAQRGLEGGGGHGRGQSGRHRDREGGA